MCGVRVNYFTEFSAGSKSPEIEVEVGFIHIPMPSSLSDINVQRMFYTSLQQSADGSREIFDF